MISTIFNIITDESGQGIAEYALIMAFVVLVCVSGFAALGPSVRDRITAFAGEAYK